MAEHTTPVPNHASSTGQAMTGGDWLDNHFEASRPEYEAQLRAVGIQAGWRVLDAASGSGSFLPWLAELVGPRGGLAALGLRQNSDFSRPNRGCWGLKWGFIPIIRPSRSVEGPHCSKIVVLVGKEKT